MNTTQFLETAQWIISLYSSDIQKALFSGEIVHQYSTNKDLKAREGMISATISATHELAALIPRLRESEDAIAILEAFNLTQLIDEAFPVKIATALITESPQPNQVFYSLVFALQGAWYLFVNTIPKIETLVIPSVLKDKEMSEELLTLEIRMSGDSRAGADVIASVFKGVNQIYQSITAVLKLDSTASLSVVYVTSGSGFRFDLKGLATQLNTSRNYLLKAGRKFATVKLTISDIIRR